MKQTVNVAIRLVNASDWVPSKDTFESTVRQINNGTEIDRIYRYHPCSADRVFEAWTHYDTKSFVLGRLWLQQTFAAALKRAALPSTEGVNAANVAIKRTFEGKPHVGHYGTKVNANISHHKGVLALVASDETLVGVDVMTLELVPVEPITGSAVSEFFRVLRDNFTDAEWCWICSKSSAVDLSVDANCATALKRFLTLWTLKESYIKALGIGLGMSLQRMEFHLDRSDVENASFYIDPKETNVRLLLDQKLQSQWTFQVFERRDWNAVGAAAVGPIADCLTVSSFGTSWKSEVVQEVVAAPHVAHQVVFTVEAVSVSQILAGMAPLATPENGAELNDEAA